MLTSFSIREDYWENFTLNNEDVQYLYEHLLEIETPQTPQELVAVLVEDRLRREREAMERKQSEGGDVYLPKESYKEGDKLVFPALAGQSGSVTTVRPANSLLEETFEVIEVAFENGESRQFATGLQEHTLNNPPEISDDDPLLSPQAVISTWSKVLEERLTEDLSNNDDFVYIAGRWFPIALVVDINEGHLNLAEAVLDMHGGGPLPTSEIVNNVDLPEGDSPKLAEFSMDMALQEDKRFDEVGSAGQVLWFLHRLEPEAVQRTPITLRYSAADYDRSVLTDEMLGFEQRIDDELSEVQEEPDGEENVQVHLIYPHWRTGTLPLTKRIQRMFPTAYESPRIRFMLVDGQTGEQFPGWVVRLERYVYGLRDWYLKKGVFPGSFVTAKPGENPGEVIVDVDSHRSSKEWVRTALVGADGGVVYGTLKQQVETSFDERMAVYMPSELEGLDAAWEKKVNNPPPFEQVVVNTLKELAKLNPQSHVHARELYSALNVVIRTPPGPMLALLASRPWFTHVGDLHFRYDDEQS
ncbi:MAG: hypothetical protein DWQ07_00710 [Chloroflexi bacterium]|nr:MAG: hypothetical protein DWQ07_00710 [Chloroflexota bacterium]MBL1195853.1 hypothetical protein [Chloroflexota bacterium]NOH13145.1 hypothetical protein [Chloroflexota bacterium]